MIFKFWRDHYGNHEVTLLSSQNNYIISDDVIHWVYSCGGRDHIKFIYLGKCEAIQIAWDTMGIPIGRGVTREIDQIWLVNRKLANLEGNTK